MLDTPVARVLADLATNETRMTTDTSGRRLLCRRGEFEDRGFARSYALIEELTAELNRSERQTYEKLIRMVAHEVTNTVTATNSLLESSRRYAEQLQVPEDRSDYLMSLNVLIARNSNLNAFIDALGELVRLPEPNLEAVDIEQLIRAIAIMFKAELEQRQIRLAVHVEMDLPPVSMDRSQMDRVLINLMRNAIEAIERDGGIEIVAARDGDYLSLCVIDDGVGLSEETRAKLFEPFFTTKRHGEGLGLTLVKEILLQHGFAFTLDCANGKTRFRIGMPVAETGYPPQRD
jgi:signal transduction histidine kinase